MSTYFESFRQQSRPKLSRDTFFPTNPVEGKIEYTNTSGQPLIYNRILLFINCNITYCWPNDRTDLKKVNDTKSFLVHRETAVIAGEKEKPPPGVPRKVHILAAGRKHTFEFSEEARIPASALPSLAVDNNNDNDGTKSYFRSPNTIVAWTVQVGIASVEGMVTMGIEKEIFVISPVSRTKWIADTKQTTDHAADLEGYCCYCCCCCGCLGRVSASLELKQSVVASLSQSLEFTAFINNSEGEDDITGIEVSLVCIAKIPWAISTYGKIPADKCRATRVFGTRLIPDGCVPMKMKRTIQGSVKFAAGSPPTITSPYIELEWQVRLRLIQESQCKVSDPVFHSHPILVGNTVEDAENVGCADAFDKMRQNEYNFLWKNVLGSLRSADLKEPDVIAPEFCLTSRFPSVSIAPGAATTTTTPFVPPPSRESLSSPLLLAPSAGDDDDHHTHLASRPTTTVEFRDDDEDITDSRQGMIVPLSSDPMSDLHQKRNNNGNVVEYDDDDGAMTFNANAKISLSGDFEMKGVNSSGML